MKEEEFIIMLVGTITFNAKAILVEEQYLTHSWGDKEGHTFPE